LARDPAAVLRDVRNGVIGVARALADYGVVITADEQVDGRATDAERDRRRVNGGG
jgi:N-methylhydantoinase B